MLIATIIEFWTSKGAKDLDAISSKDNDISMSGVGLVNNTHFLGSDKEAILWM